MRIKNILHLVSRKKSDVKSTSFYCLCLCFCINYAVYSQHNTTQNILPLTTVIKQLEEKWAPYTFTYADDVVSNIMVPELQAELSLEESLAYLEHRSILSFIVIGDNFISINKKKNRSLICGTIFDWETKKPISKAIIKANDLITISDDTGNFEFEVLPIDNVVVNHTRYRNQVISIDVFEREDCPIINLYPKAEVLDKVIINGLLTKGISKTDFGSFQVDYKDFGMLPGLIETDVLQTIQALPGVQSADETISNINIRGGTNDQNLILWDGIKMYQSGHFFGLISVFNPNITEQASVLKNGTSSEFTDGVSGSILMNTNTDVNQQLHASAGVNLINTDVFVDAPIGQKSSLQISARKALSNFLETPTYTKYFERISQNNELENSQMQINSDISFDFYDANLRWNYNISEKDKLRINFLLIHDELFFTENAIINTIETSRQSSIIQNSIAGGISYHRDWSDTFETDLQVYETDYTLKAVNANLVQQQRFLQKNIVSETGIKLKSSFKIRENIKLLNGYQLSETGITNLNDVDSPVFRRKEARVIRTHGIFSEISYKSPKKNHIANIGVRYTYNEKFKSHFIEPRLSYNLSFLDHFNLLIQGELKHQNTSQVIKFQNDFLGIEKRRWVLSNEQDIPVIEGKQVSAGVHYNYKGWLVSAETYFKNVMGITSESQGFQNRYKETIASGSYTVKGFEFIINKRLEKVSAWAGYSYAINNYDFKEPIAQIFPNSVDIRHLISLGAVYIFNDFKVSGGINWHSGLPTTLPANTQGIDGEIIYQEENSSQLKPYLRADISASYDFNITKKVKGHAGVSVWNILNRENVVSSFYMLNDQNSAERFDQNALNLTPNATLRVSF